MFNECYFSIKTRGAKDNVQEFEEMLEHSCDEENKHNGPYLAGLYEISDDFQHQYCTKDTLVSELYGSCNTSAYVSMCDGELTLYDDLKDEDENITCLRKESERLNLRIQVSSEEPNAEFCEYIEYNNGEKIQVLEGAFIEQIPYVFNSLEECNKDIESINKQLDTNYSLLTQEEFDNYCKTREHYIDYNELRNLYYGEELELCAIIGSVDDK